MILAACIVLALVVFLVMGMTLSTPETASTTPEMASTSSTTATAKAVVHTTIKTTSSTVVQPGTPVPPPTTIWNFHLRSTDASGQQYTDVTLTANDKDYVLGTFVGTCKTLADSDLKVASEISAIQCLSQGKGDEVGVFKQGNAYVVKKGTIELGVAGKPDTHGTFTVIQTLP